MSKKKAFDSSETEVEASENLVEQSELEGISNAKAEVAESEPAKKVEKVSVAKAAKVVKMGVYKFLSLYPQDIYIETLLKFNYPKSFFTKDEWFQRIQDILNTPVYN